MSTHSSRGARLSALDDLPVHQHADVIARPVSERWNWTERWYFNLQAPTGELIAILGGGIFRNTGVTESYLCVIDANQQINHRSTGSLEPGSDGLSDGVASFSIASPMKEWEISIEIPECDTSLNLRFDSKQEPFLLKPVWAGPDRDSDDFDQWEHFVQPGQITGTVQVHGEVLGITEFSSFRDRTWGVRSRRPKLHNWVVLHLENGSYMSLVHQEVADGRILYSHAGLVTGDGRVELLAIEEHDITFDPVSRVPSEGTFYLRGDGRDMTLHMSRQGQGIRVLGAGYDATQGKTRDASSATSCNTWNLKDPETLSKVGRGTIDTGVRCSLVSGVSNQTGYGVWETAIGQSHYRYGAGLRAR